MLIEAKENVEERPLLTFALVINLIDNQSRRAICQKKAGFMGFKETTLDFHRVEWLMNDNKNGSQRFWKR